MPQVVTSGGRHHAAGGGDAAECLMEIRGEGDCGTERPSFSLSRSALPILISLYSSAGYLLSLHKLRSINRLFLDYDAIVL